ncbi:hypothetical protein MNBD_GAMMA08-1218, partial [hydrothermal vent metagenome]
TGVFINKKTDKQGAGFSNEHPELGETGY